MNKNTKRAARREARPLGRESPNPRAGIHRCRWPMFRSLSASDEGPEDRKRKGNRWTFFFAPKGPAKIRAWTQALRRALNAGRVDVQVEEGKGSAVLVWPEAVTFYSAYRIHKRAREHDSSFQTLGLPRCVDQKLEPGAESATELAPEPGAESATFLFSPSPSC